MEFAIVLDVFRAFEREGVRYKVEGHDAAAGSSGRLDVLVNNAGIYPLAGFLEMAAAQWDEVVDANLKSAFLCTQAVARRMAAQGSGGSIVNVSSIEAFRPAPSHAHYNAAKAGLEMLTRSSAFELARAMLLRGKAVFVTGAARGIGRGIAGALACPGGVETPMLRDVAEWLAPRLGRAADELFEQMKPQQIGRRIQPVEVGRVVAFLLSDHAAIIRGQAINVDGGDTPY